MTLSSFSSDPTAHSQSRHLAIVGVVLIVLCIVMAMLSNLYLASKNAGYHELLSTTNDVALLKQSFARLQQETHWVNGISFVAHGCAAAGALLIGIAILRKRYAESWLLWTTFFLAAVLMAFGGLHVVIGLLMIGVVILRGSKFAARFHDQPKTL